MKRLLVVAFWSSAILACGTDPQFDVSGQWSLVETFTNGTIHCDATGQLLLSQSSNGTRFIMYYQHVHWKVLRGYMFGTMMCVALFAWLELCGGGRPRF